MSLLCDDQYFKLRCLSIIFFNVLVKCEVVVCVMLWYSIVLDRIAPGMALWFFCVASAWI